MSAASSTPTRRGPGRLVGWVLVAVGLALPVIAQAGVGPLPDRAHGGAVALSIGGWILMGGVALFSLLGFALSMSRGLRREA